MIIADIFESNASTFITELRTKKMVLLSVFNSSRKDGDYADTVWANYMIASEALDAAEKRLNLIHHSQSPFCSSEAAERCRYVESTPGCIDCGKERDHVEA